MDTNLDLMAVEAIKKGDRQRYRELVERHEQQVYAVAWSRLGDADLAQEATQETFIKAYQHLAFLHQGGRFSAWITAIARNIAVNLGLKHRNELKRRKRWVLEQAESIQSPPEGDSAEEESFTLETLRESLAELPIQHRECLVMFYLEGRSIAEAAHALGVSEAAFKTRLFRARGVLRKHLDIRLDASLAKLRPRHAVAPIIMAMLSTQKAQAACSIGSATGILTKATVGITRLLPFKLLMMVPWLTGLIPGLLFHYKMGQLELKNFRDPEGFRAQIYKRNLTRSLFRTPILMAVIIFCCAVVMGIGGRQRYFLFFGFVGIFYILVVLGQLRFNRSKFIVFNLCGIAVLTIAFLAMGFFKLPSQILFYSQALFFIFLGLSFRYRALRMDYSLFLRLIKGMIPESPVPESERELSRQEILAFARFLGERWLVVYVCQRKESIQLRLASVRPSVWHDGFSPLIWQGSSVLTVAFDGHVQVRLGTRDQRSIARLQKESGIQIESLESSAEKAVSWALHAFLMGDKLQAERYLGQQPEEEIFHVQPQQSRGVRWRKHFMLGTGLLLVILTTWSLLKDAYYYPTQGRRLKAVQVSENEVRAALAQLDSTSNQEPEIWEAFDSALRFECLVLPSRELFTPKAWENIRQHFREQLSPYTTRMSRDTDLGMRRLLIDGPQEIKKAILNGYITLSDLAEYGLTANTVRNCLTRVSPETYTAWTSINEIPVDNRDYMVLHVEQLAYHLQLFQLFECLDMVDPAPIIAQLRAHQVIAGNSLEGRMPVPDRKLVHGLFHCIGSEPIRDTYYALVILSMINGLDHIDRDACIQGILRFHHGKGLFGSFKKNDGLFFLGDTHDTFYAYESLRLLNALDQVKDLEKWVFRPLPSPRRLIQDPANEIDWPQIEAWVLTQRLKQSIADYHRDRKLVHPLLRQASLR
ncbi:MAG: sigma-70 family RNA polymerase sigma factor [Sedimentisphaerales bacterium]|nr:sigma-70 family RNA polymerase sigma factor [Sedimentisphaerales bacterium]